MAMAGLEEQAPWISILLSFLFIIFSLLLIRSRSGSKQLNLPPSPPRLPIIGNLHQLGSLPHRSLRDLAQKYGPLMFLQLGQIPTLVVSSAYAAEQVMKTHDLDFASRPALAGPRKILYGCQDVAFAPYGDYWRQLKKMYMLEILSNKRVQSFSFVREEEIANMVKTISNSCEDSKGLVNVHELLVTLNNDITCRVALGKKYFSNKSVLSELAREYSVLMTAFSFDDYFPVIGWMDVLTGIDARLNKSFRAWDEFLESVLNEHMESGGDENEQRDFVDVLLHVQRHSMAGISLTTNDIKSAILDIITGGTDTSSSLLEWAMTELVKHPKVMRKVQEEVRRIVGGKSNIEQDDIHQMDYLKLIIKETFRLHPSLPLLIPRECIKNTKLEGYDIPDKTMVYINAWAIGRDPASWDNAEEFHPERFINSSIDFKGQDFMLVPFGAGRRRCPGIYFAMSTIELVLANLLHRFDWELPNGMNVEDLDMIEQPGILVYKKSALVLFAKPHCLMHSCEEP